MVDKKYYRDVSVDVLGAIISAVIIAVLFFITSDFVFKPPNLHGKWYAISITDQSEHTQYIGMKLVYEVIIFQEVNSLNGTAEKRSETIDGKEYFYEYANRVKSKLKGYIDRNYFSKDKLHIQWIEKGRKRESSSYFNITRFNDNYMYGTFSSTISSSNGRIEWVRDLNDAKELYNK